MYKVFIKDIPLILTDSEEEFNKNGCSFKFRFYGTESLSDAVSFIQENEKSALVFHSDLHRVWELFNSLFKVVIAAGGIVINTSGDYLLIERNGKWDLPKGKMEKGESIEQSALREVEEETGVTYLKITKPLKTTYHTYDIEEKAVLKHTYWFLMKTPDTKLLVPQQNEGITEAKWVDKKTFCDLIGQSYASIVDLVEREKTILF